MPWLQKSKLLAKEADALKTLPGDVESQNVEDARRLSTLSRSIAVIEFDAKGFVLTANDNLLSILG